MKDVTVIKRQVHGGVEAEDLVKKEVLFYCFVFFRMSLEPASPFVSHTYKDISIFSSKGSQEEINKKISHSMENWA
jgi:hypothetical protein